MEVLGIFVPNWILIAVPALMIVAGILAFLAIRIPPTSKLEIFGTMIEIYHLPYWRMRRVAKSSAFLVFSDETGWLGHGTAKYAKDKADYRLDDRVRELAPIGAGQAIAVDVKRLPSKKLIVCNIYDDVKRISSESFSTGFSNSVKLLKKLVPNSIFPGNSIMMGDPTDDWNYFAKRISPNDAARIVLDAISKCNGEVGTVRIIVQKETHARAYAEELEHLSESRHRYSKELAGV